LSWTIRITSEHSSQPVHLRSIPFAIRIRALAATKLGSGGEAPHRGPISGFTAKRDCSSTVFQRAASRLGCSGPISSFHYVRNVAPLSARRYARNDQTHNRLLDRLLSGGPA